MATFLHDTVPGRGRLSEGEPVLLQVPGKEQPREVLMGVGNGVASVIMLTFTKRPGPHADTAWAVVG